MRFLGWILLFGTSLRAAPIPVTGSFDNTTWDLVTPEFRFHQPNSSFVPEIFWCVFEEPCQIAKTQEVAQSDVVQPGLTYFDGRPGLVFPYNATFEGHLTYHAPDFLWTQDTAQKEVLPISVSGILRAWELNPITNERLRLRHDITFTGTGTVELQGTELTADLRDGAPGLTVGLMATGRFTGFATEVPEPSTFALLGLALPLLRLLRKRHRSAGPELAAM